MAVCCSSITLRIATARRNRAYSDKGRDCLNPHGHYYKLASNLASKQKIVLAWLRLFYNKEAGEQQQGPIPIGRHRGYDYCTSTI
jgi:hypothetical protein